MQYLFTFFALTAIFRIEKPADAPPPNIVLIFMDDLGYGDLECYGGYPQHTPNLNRLAAEGMRLTNYYAAQAVCSASRAALLTGCYPNRVGISGALNHESKIALHPREETIAELLKAKGYRTGIFGKWHLGSRETFLPLQQGFDEYFGLPYSNDMWPVNYDGTPLDTTNYRGRYPILPLMEGNQPLRYLKTLDDQADLTKVYTERAVRFIKENHEKPFFLYLPHAMPHVPLAASQNFRGKSGQGLFGDVLMEIDWSVGEVMRALEMHGLSNNTLFIFTSDNGPWRTYGNHAGSTGGLREGKGTAWDGGVKVPCIMRWPGRIAAGSVCNKLVAAMDLLPTIAHACKADLPKEKIDGVSLWPLLDAQPGANPRTEFVYYYDRNNLKGIRKGQWKLVFPCSSQTYLHPGATADDGFPGKWGKTEVPLALYDLSSDPAETIDLKDRHPDVVTELSALADKYRRMLGDDLVKVEGTEVRAPGKVE